MQPSTLPFFVSLGVLALFFLSKVRAAANAENEGHYTVRHGDRGLSACGRRSNSTGINAQAVSHGQLADGPACTLCVPTQM